MGQPDQGTVRDLACYRIEIARNDLRTACARELLELIEAYCLDRMGK